MLNKESHQDQDDFACGALTRLRMCKGRERAGDAVTPHEVAVSAENGELVGFRLHAQNFNSLIRAHLGLETCDAMR